MNKTYQQLKAEAAIRKENEALELARKITTSTRFSPGESPKLTPKPKRAPIKEIRAKIKALRNKGVK